MSESKSNPLKPLEKVRDKHDVIIITEKLDGKYLPEISGGEEIWNWRPDW